MKAVLIDAELQETIKQGLILDKIKETVERLRTIDRRDIPEAVTGYDDAINDVLNGAFDDVYEAYETLQQACSRLVHIMRELLEIRSFIGEM